MCASGVLPGDRVGLVGPACVIASFHDGHSVRAFYRELQPAAATCTAIPLCSIPQHQDFTLQVFKIPGIQPSSGLSLPHISILFPTHTATVIT